MVFVDSNVPMYVAGRDHPLRDAARRFLERARSGEVETCTSTEVLQEILYRYSALKRLELARALAIEPRLLLLDEVLAGLNPSEIRDIVPVIRGIRDRGVTIVLTEHVMQAVMSLAEQILAKKSSRIDVPKDLSLPVPTAIVTDYLGVTVRRTRIFRTGRRSCFATSLGIRNTIISADSG